MLTKAEREERLRLLAEGYTMEEIAKKLGYSVAGIKIWFYRRGVRLRRGKSEGLPD